MSPAAAQDSLNTISVTTPTNNSTAASSTNCVYVSAGSAHTSNTDCVAISNNVTLVSGLRSVSIGKKPAASQFTGVTDLTSITSDPSLGTDTTKGGILCMNALSNTTTGNTGFGYNVGSSLTSGTNNAFMGSNITGTGNPTTTICLGNNITTGTSNSALVLLGNNFATGNTNTQIILAVGAITSSTGRITIGTVTTPINTSNAVGAAGTAAAPPTPAQYLRTTVNGVSLRIPLFNP